MARGMRIRQRESSLYYLFYIASDNQVFQK
jgi:hypothetical protein